MADAKLTKVNWRSLHSLWIKKKNKERSVKLGGLRDMIGSIQCALKIREKNWSNEDPIEEKLSPIMCTLVKLIVEQRDSLAQLGQTQF